MAARKARKLSSYEPMAPHGSVKEHDVMQSCYRPRGRLNRSGQKVAKTEPLTPRPAQYQEADLSGQIVLCSGTTEHQIDAFLPVPADSTRGTKTTKIVHQIVGFAAIGCAIMVFMLMTPARP